MLLALALCGCSRSEVVAYRVRRETPAPVALAPVPVPSVAVATPTPAAALDWTAPAGWKPGPVSAMRAGSFYVPTAAGDLDLSITSLGGAAGGDLANVNRWRGQVSLAPLTETEMAAAVTRESSNGLSLLIVDFAANGPGAQRILAAMIPVGEKVWFFKLMGPEAAVGGNKPAFLEFLRTVRPAKT